jgi:hypothetical protein
MAAEVPEVLLFLRVPLKRVLKTILDVLCSSIQ